MRPPGHNFRLFTVVGLLLLHGMSSIASLRAEEGTRGGSAGAAQFEALKARYLKIRNTDVNLARKGEWTAVGKEFAEFARRFPASSFASAAIFHAGLVQEQFYSVLNEPPFLEESCRYFEEVYARFPADPLADDALIRCADLMLKAGRRADARALYLKVREQFPSGDMGMLAEARLSALSDREDGDGIDESTREGGMEERERRALRSGKPLIVLDPGHGGEDLGAVGIGGLFEKDVVLQVAFELEQLLEQKYGAVVRLTRRTDRFVPLIDRTTFANDFEATLFISLHANASPAHALHGLEIYYLDNSGDKATKTLAERENASVQYEGSQADLQYMLSDLIQHMKLEESIQLARSLQKAAVRELAGRSYKIRDLGVKKAPFYVLVGAHMPCVLVELSFIDHAEEGVLLSTKEYRTALAQGLYRGIIEFLQRQ